MTPLRQRMIADMQLRGLSKATQTAYVHAVRQLAEHYGKSPARISEEEVRQYLLYLRDIKQVSGGTYTVALYGIKFIYRYTLQRAWRTLELARAPQTKKLPVVLSTTEVRRVLQCVRSLCYRACLSTIYTCGLRIQEGVHLQVRDIDSDRMLIHVRYGKRDKARYVPLPQCTLDILRRYWCTHRHTAWLFPARMGGTRGVLPTASMPMSVRGVRGAFQAALQACAIQKPATVHTLRHSYATHLLEAGVHLRLIQAYFFHSATASTAIYTHLTPKAEAGAVAVINQVMENL